MAEHEEQQAEPNLAELTNKYKNVAHQASTTFGEKGDALKEERNALYGQIIDKVTTQMIDGSR